MGRLILMLIMVGRKEVSEYSKERNLYAISIMMAIVKKPLQNTMMKLGERIDRLFFEQINPLVKS